MTPMHEYMKKWTMKYQPEYLLDLNNVLLANPAINSYVASMAKLMVIAFTAGRMYQHDNQETDPEKLPQ